MCLYVDEERTAKARETRKPGSYVTRYKVLNVAALWTGIYDYPVLVSDNYPTYVWKVGWNSAGLPEGYKLPRNTMLVTQAIHVYTTRKTARRIAGTRPILAMRCYADDLIAVSERGSGDETYTKVLVTGEAMAAALVGYSFRQHERTEQYLNFVKDAA